VLFPTP
jgi:hypothetical protein